MNYANIFAKMFPERNFCKVNMFPERNFQTCEMFFERNVLIAHCGLALGLAKIVGGWLVPVAKGYLYKMREELTYKI